MDCCTICSQSSYYYHRGNKIPLRENPQRISVVTPKRGESAQKQKLQRRVIDAKQTEKIKNVAYDIAVYEATVGAKSTVSFKKMVANSIGDSVIVLPCFKNSDGKDLTMTNYLYVKLKREGDFKTLQAIASNFQLKIVEQNKFMPLWYTLTITPETRRNTLEVANEIFETGLFASSFADFSYDALECSYDPQFAIQLGLYNGSYTGVDISICSAWNYATGLGIKIAIVDQGIDMAHNDLAANIYSLGYDTETGTSPSQLYGSHGTHCAGIAAAVRNNGQQIAGVAPDAKLISVSNSLSWSTTLEGKLANGINWAWQNGADIISCSWWCNQNDILEDAIDASLFSGREGKGVIFVKSAGNNYGDSISYPGNYCSEVLTVGSIGSNGNRSSFASVGSMMDVVAPGANIWSTIPNNSTGYMSGTSMAAPHVAGLAALILSRNPSLSGQQVRNIIESNTKKVGTLNYGTLKANGTWNNEYGYGLIDAHEAVKNTPRY